MQFPQIGQAECNTLFKDSRGYSEVNKSVYHQHTQIKNKIK